MGAAKNFLLLKINENMPFYFKNMGIMPEVFFYFNSRVGGGGEWWQGFLGSLWTRACPYIIL